MDLRQLEIFCAVIAAGSLTLAARQTGRSQSAVTRMVQELEAQLGFALFDRNGPRITPTERALLFHDEVERSLAGLRAIEERAAALAREEGARLDIVAAPALASGLVPAALGRLGTCLPHRISLTSQPAGEVVRALLDRRAHLGFASLPLEHRGLDLHWIGESHCVAVLPAGHPLAAQERVALRDLAGQRLITLADPHRQFRRHIDAALAGAGSRPPSLMVVNASLNAIMAARTGLGVALIDPVTAVGVPVEGVMARPIDVTIPYFWGVATPAAHPPSPAAQAVITAAAEAAAMLPGFIQHPPQALARLMAPEDLAP
ncbi:LysR family transcriptional regulator [Roseomonas elaeocarpi]|uniref:LysR family transcriptional regulator n=1 Tax=Roseomonas elaeocarpi TaxID=907779 RepID=A0ABV6JN02_9PROT